MEELKQKTKKDKANDLFQKDPAAYLEKFGRAIERAAGAPNRPAHSTKMVADIRLTLFFRSEIPGLKAKITSSLAPAKKEILERILSLNPTQRDTLQGRAKSWLRGYSEGREDARADSQVKAGNRKPEDTRTGTIKGRLIRCHLRERPGIGFTAYWHSLCEQAPYKKSYLTRH